MSRAAGGDINSHLSVRLWQRDPDGGWWPLKGKGVSVRMGEAEGRGRPGPSRKFDPASFEPPPRPMPGFGECDGRG